MLWCGFFFLYKKIVCFPVKEATIWHQMGINNILAVRVEDENPLNKDNRDLTERYSNYSNHNYIHAETKHITLKDYNIFEVPYQKSQFDGLL